MSGKKQKNFFLQTCTSFQNFFQKLLLPKKQKKISIYSMTNHVNPFETEYRYYDETGDPFDPDNLANWRGTNKIDLLTYQSKSSLK